LSGEPGPRVLNAGAGGGSFSVKLAERGFEPTSIDASVVAVELLRSRVPGEVAVADVSDLPYPHGTFDAAILGEVLEHVPDDSAALTEVARVLRPGGTLALSVPAGRPGESDRWAGHVRRYSRSSLVTACE